MKRGPLAQQVRASRLISREGRNFGKYKFLKISFINLLHNK